jgi:hypothetical protein
MIKKEIEIVVKSEKATKGVKDLKGQINDVGTASDNATKKTTQGFKGTESAISGVSPALSQTISGMKGMLKAMVAIVANPLGLVLVAIVGALTLLFNAFTSTKAGGEQLEQVMAGVGAVIDVVRDRILNVGNAIVKFFSGDFKGALEEGRAAVNGFGDEVAKEFQAAADATKVLQEVSDAMRGLSVSRARLDKDLAVSKELLTDENASFKDKKNALDAIKKAEGEQTAQELANAKRKLAAILALNAQSDSGKEDLEAAASAEIALIALERKSAEDRRNINKQEERANNDEKSRIKGLEDARKAAAKAAQDRAKVAADAAKERLRVVNEQAKQEITDALTNTKLGFDEQRKLIAENNKLSEKDRADFLKKINESELKAIDDHAKAIADLEKRYRTEAQDAEAITAQQKLDLARTRAEQEIELLAQTEEEKAALLLLLNAKFAQQQKDLDKTTAEAKKIKDKKDAQDEIDLENLKTNSKIQALNNLSTVAQGLEALAGKRTVASKALAVATTLVDTYQSATAAFKAQQTLATPDAPIRGAIAAAAAVAAGLANVKQILSVKVAGQGGGSGGNTATATATQQPAFNLVGRSNVNQLRTGLDELDTPPVRAFVVGQDVTSQQAADRSTRSQAAFG